jgi:hypothetical protein
MTTSERRPLIAAVLLIPLVIGLALAAFAWPTARLAPRDLPIGVAGPSQASTPIEQRLGEHEGAFDVRRYADEAAARQAIEDREVYGALVAGPQGLTVLTASAASPLVAQLLQQSFAALSTGSGPPARVVDVVPADPDDPRGAALGASIFPLLLAGVLIGVALSFLAKPGLVQVGALVTSAVLTGAAAAGVAQGWLGILGGNVLANAGVFGLTVATVGAVVIGLNAVLGKLGIPIGAMLMIFIGNPFSGITSAPELLPKPVGMLGQLLPPGAGGTLLRNTAFFDGAAATGPLLVLLGWAALGLIGVAVAALRAARRPAETPAPALVPV